MAADETTYLIDHMQQIAQKTKTNALQTYEYHVMPWRNVEVLIVRFPGFMQLPLQTVFDPHDQRFPLSYHWQMEFPDHLLEAARHTMYHAHRSAKRVSCGYFILQFCSMY